MAGPEGKPVSDGRNSVAEILGNSYPLLYAGRRMHVSPVTGAGVW